MAHSGTSQGCFAASMAGSDSDYIISGWVSIQKSPKIQREGEYVPRGTYCIKYYNLIKIIYFLIPPHRKFVNLSFCIL